MTRSHSALRLAAARLRAVVVHRHACAFAAPPLALVLLLAGCPTDHVSLGDDTFTALDGGGADGGHAIGGSGGSSHAGSGGLGGGGGGFVPPGEPRGASCGSRSLPSCPPNHFCAFDEQDQCGDGDRTGHCQSFPSSCTTEVNPVCGCDGGSYPNACIAALFGVSVRHEGVCNMGGSNGSPCGGPFRCPADQFCRFGGGRCSGSPQAAGVCTPIPTDCRRDSRTVCGCDGRTYSSECQAAMESVSVQHLGECDGGSDSDAGVPGGRVCGGFQGAPCNMGEYCDFAAGDGCGVADGRGVCKPMPFGCPQQFAPVCGCDGMSYPNACAAASQGVSIEHDGECQ